jgi:hypothetical protein
VNTKRTGTLLTRAGLLALAAALLGCTEDPPEMQWSRSFGQDTAVCSIRQTSDRGFIAAGRVRLTMLDLDFYLLKMDSAGNVEWQRTYGTIAGRGSDEMEYVRQTADGGYVMCGSGDESTQAVVIKTDPSGNEQWRFSAFPQAVNYAIEQTQDRGYITGGPWSRRDSIFLMKLDSAGNLQWRRTYVEYYPYERNNIPVRLTRDGGCVIAARGLLRTDSVGNLLWRQEYPDVRVLSSVEQARDGGFICAGTAQAQMPSGGVRPTNMVLLKTDSAGNTQWQKVFTQGRLSMGRCAWQTSDGGFVVGGYVTLADTARATLVKVNAQGGIVWTVTTPEYRRVEAGQQTADGGFVLNGYHSIWRLGPATK